MRQFEFAACLRQKQDTRTEALTRNDVSSCQKQFPPAQLLDYPTFGSDATTPISGPAQERALARSVEKTLDMEWPTADSMRPLEEYFGIALVLCAIGALVWGFFLGLPGCTRRQEMRISGAVSSALALVAFAGASTALIVWMPELNPYLVFLVALLVALLVAAMRLGVRIQKRRTANP